MSSNFEFIKAEWPDLYEAAVNAEKHTFAGPRTCAFYSRYTLEQAVKWMYRHDSSLKQPYQDKLAALIHERTFMQSLGTGLFDRVRFIHKLGNHAAHEGSRIKDREAYAGLKHLFAFLCWFTRTYCPHPPKEILFKESLIPKTGEAGKSAQQLRQLLDQLAQKDRRLQEEQRKRAQSEEEILRLQEEIQSIKAANRKKIPAKDYTEQETRELFIDLMLREAGWDLDSPSVSAEYRLTGLSTKSGTGIADYVLWGDNGLPLAVIEAKRTKQSPEAGQDQAEQYAHSLEKTKGQRPVIFYTNGYETWLWDDCYYPPRSVQGFYTKDQLQLLILRRTTRKPLDTMPIDAAILDPKRTYHHIGIKRVTESFSEGHRKALVVMATGTGKTRFSVALVKLLMQANWARRVLFLADRINLLTQAKRAYNENYKNLSAVNLLEKKEDADSRIVFSTYPTMMNCIDETRGGDVKRFGVGHFDLIIIDEAHRSIYLKYKAIFDYFDAMLLGLTATPVAEVDRNTYRLFDLEDNVPTHYYELEEAVRDGWLVNYHRFSVPVRFLREGIRYDELSPEEQEQYEALFYDEANRTLPEIIPAKALNKWLFNRDTIEKVLIHLMEYGVRVKGGDKLGKTIIFAQNLKHADEIKKQFDKLFPHHKGKFMRAITYKTHSAQDLIDRFSLADEEPTIAVSVDMLDTGIDIHEIVNLVFFKEVFSRAKFWQMIGRGTRTRPNLFGPGDNKTHFNVFDFCRNFEYFDENPQGITPVQSEPLSQQIFKKRVLLAHLLNDPEHKVDETDIKFYNHLSQTLHQEVKGLNLDAFNVRPRRQYVETWSNRVRWDQISLTDVTDLMENVAQLMSASGEDEIARRFDLLILGLQLSIVENGTHRQSLLAKLGELAVALQGLTMIPQVKAQIEIIRLVQSETFKQHPTLWELEQIRQALRDLIRLIHRSKQRIIYSDFEDTFGAATGEVKSIKPDETFDNYRKKAAAYIRENENHITIYRLKHNMPITVAELSELERILFTDSGLSQPGDIARVYGTQKPLGRFIRGIVGLDREAVRAAFADFLRGSHFTSQQINFINQILDYYISNGYLDKSLLMDQPFSDIHHQGPFGLFEQDQVDNITGIIDTINNNIVGL
ncbi:MAG: DEAD/DEAH box helicase family protein [bacterium]|nr:DEAD/DEAH box helicase family protein [bacterium]